jgi:hypothetical protein
MKFSVVATLAALAPATSTCAGAIIAGFQGYPRSVSRRLPGRYLFMHRILSPAT